MEYNTIQEQIAMLCIAALILLTIIFIILLVIDSCRLCKLVRTYNKRRRYLNANLITFIKRRPVFTPRIKQLIRFIRKFGFDVRFVGINHFSWDNTAYIPNKKQIVINPNQCLQVNTDNNDEHATLWALAHEFGHGLADITGKTYYPYVMGELKFSMFNVEVVKDENQAWHFAYRCMSRLFPNDRDLLKGFDGIYELCMDSYTVKHEEMEQLNEKIADKKRKINDENPFAS